MSELRFTVRGAPVPWQRAAGRGRRRYTPERQRVYQSYVRTVAVMSCSRVERTPGTWEFRTAQAWPEGYAGPVAVEIAVYWPDARRRDADNACKTVMDSIQARPKKGLRGVIADDSQVKELRVTTAIDRENPRVEVVVRMLPEVAR